MLSAVGSNLKMDKFLMQHLWMLLDVVVVLPGSCHSGPQRLRSFWSVSKIATFGQVQRHSVFERLCKNQSDLSDLTVNMRRVTGSP